MTSTTTPKFVFEGTELLARALHAELLARRRATFEHDLKNVMHGLLSGTELLSKALATSSPRIPPAECLALLQQQLARAQGTLNHLLDEIAPAETAPSDIDLANLIEECTHALRHQLQRFELTMSVDSQLTIRANRARLKDALMCMLLDAMDHAAARSTLTLTARHEQDDIAHLELRHTLSDAPPSEALAYIDEIVRPDAGSIELTTESGSRTIVVRFPTASAAAVDANARRLVIVDANRDAADSLAMLVQLEGFEAQAAYDVESAVQSARARPTLAVVLDVDGSVDADDAIARLRASSKSPVRIVGMSHGTEQRIANLDAQLRKPLDLSALRAALDES